MYELYLHIVLVVYEIHIQGSHATRVVSTSHKPLVFERSIQLDYDNFRLTVY